MLESFQRTFTPMNLSNDPDGIKIFWIELLWRGQIPLYEYDHGGFHIPKRLKQTLNSQKFTITQIFLPFLYIVTISGFHLLVGIPNTHLIILPCPRSAEHSSNHMYVLHCSTSQCAQHLH